MGLSKKSGIRKITVNDRKYYWTIKSDFQALKLIVRIGLVSKPNYFFVFACNYEDQWLAFPNKVNNEVKAVTPKLIREAIIFYEASNIWNAKGKPSLRYENGAFQY